MNTKELKACPWGSDHQLHPFTMGEDTPMVECRHTGCPIERTAIEVESWNTRAQVAVLTEGDVLAEYDHLASIHGDKTGIMFGMGFLRDRLLAALSKKRDQKTATSGE